MDELENQELQKQNKLEKEREQLLSIQKLKSDIQSKQQIINRLKEKKTNVELEVTDLEQQYKRVTNRYNNYQQQKHKETKTQEKDKGKDSDDEEQIEKKLEEKILFHLDRYLGPIDKQIKSEIMHLKELTTRELDNDTEYAKTNFNAVSVKSQLVNEDQDQENQDQKQDQVKSANEVQNYYFSTFKVQRKTNFYELKQASCHFWKLVEERREDQNQLKQIDNKLKKSRQNKNSKSAFFQDPLYEQYELVDDKDFKVLDNDIVDRYFMSKTSELNLVQVELKQKKIKKNETELLEVKEDENQENEEDEEQESSKKKVNPLLKISNDFFRRVPLLRPFFIINNQMLEEKFQLSQQKLRKGFRFDDNHCCFFFFNVIMIILCSLHLSYSQVLSILQKHNVDVVYQMDIQRQDARYSFDQISTYIDIEDFLIKSRFKDELFKTDSVIRTHYEIVGVVRLRQIRTTEVECPGLKPSDPFVQDEIKCYSQIITKETTQINDLGSGKLDKYEWQKYQEPDIIGSMHTIKGKFAEYGSAGYTQDFYSDTMFEEFESNMEDYIRSGFIDRSMRMLIIIFTLANKNDGYFLTMELLVECSGQGIFPTVNLKTYLPNFSLFEYGNQMVALKSLKIFVSVIYTLMVLKLIFSHPSANGGFYPRYFLTLQGFLNAAIIILNYLSIAFEDEQIAMNLDPNILIKLENFEDLWPVAVLYEKVSIVEGILLGALIVRLGLYFQFYKMFEMMIVTVEKALIQFVLSSIFIGIFITGFTLIVMNNWGNQLEKYTTFVNSFCELFLICVSIFDSSQFTYNTNALIFYFVYFFVVAFFLVLLANIIYIDEYRLAFLDYGNQPEPNWTIKERIRWLLSWMSEKWIRRFFGADDEQKQE